MKKVSNGGPMGEIKCECGSVLFSVRYTNIIILTLPAIPKTEYQLICENCNKCHNL